MFILIDIAAKDNGNLTKPGRIPIKAFSGWLVELETASNSLFYHFTWALGTMAG